MKFEIKIQDLVNQIQDLDYFEYSLGWFEIKHREMNISFFKENRCMVFLSLQTLYQHINSLENNHSQKINWIGEDNGLGFILSINKKKLYFENDKFKADVNLKKLKKSISKEIIRTIIKMEDINPNIVYKKLYFSLHDISKFLSY